MKQDVPNLIIEWAPNMAKKFIFMHIVDFMSLAGLLMHTCYNLSIYDSNLLI